MYCTVFPACTTSTGSDLFAPLFKVMPYSTLALMISSISLLERPEVSIISVLLSTVSKEKKAKWRGWRRGTRLLVWCSAIHNMVALPQEMRNKNSTHHHRKWHAWHLAFRNRHSIQSRRRRCSGSAGGSRAGTSSRRTRRHNDQEFASARNVALSRSCWVGCAT